jgi:hypothetical protein
MATFTQEQLTFLQKQFDTMSNEFINQTYVNPPNDGFDKDEIDELASSIFNIKGFKIAKSTKSLTTDEEVDAKEKKAKSRSKKTTKDPNKPKRAKSAYIIWTSSPEGVKKIKAENTELTHKEALSEAGKVWKQMKENGETEKYDKLALEDKERYEKEMAEYNA